MSNLIEEISRRRTFAIISHPDAGKTTLTEKFLLYGGAIAQAGVVKGKKNSRQRSKAQAETLPVRFDGFWLFYRQHVPPDRNAGNRQKAIRAWDKLAPDDALASIMAAALAKQVKTEAWKSGIGVPHASTWLNNRGWEDDWGAVAQEHAPADRRDEEWLN